MILASRDGEGAGAAENDSAAAVGRLSGEATGDLKQDIFKKCKTSTTTSDPCLGKHLKNL
jgi:hypothetical protein